METDAIKYVDTQFDKLSDLLNSYSTQLSCLKKTSQDMHNNKDDHMSHHLKLFEPWIFNLKKDLNEFQISISTVKSTDFGKDTKQITQTQWFTRLLEQENLLMKTVTQFLQNNQTVIQNSSHSLQDLSETLRSFKSKSPQDSQKAYARHDFMQNFQEINRKQEAHILAQFFLNKQQTKIYLNTVDETIEEFSKPLIDFIGKPYEPIIAQKCSIRLSEKMHPQDPKPLDFEFLPQFELQKLQRIGFSALSNFQLQTVERQQGFCIHDFKLKNGLSTSFIGSDEETTNHDLNQEVNPIRKIDLYIEKNYNVLHHMVMYDKEGHEILKDKTETYKNEKTTIELEENEVIVGVKARMHDEFKTSFANLQFIICKSE